MNVLGIETSCDETAVAVVADGRRILSSVVASQMMEHARYGGVVPEVASRRHVEQIGIVIQKSLADAGLTFPDIDAIAVTNRPGLLGALLVGVTAAKSLAMALDVPLVGIHHIEAHLYANFLTRDASDSQLGAADPAGPDFPAAALVVSGGHTDLFHLRGPGDYVLLGRTRDDAAGEAFDKCARLMGLGYPGGPAIQAAAVGGDPRAVSFPRAWMVPWPPHEPLGSDAPETYQFSFSGLKTSVRRAVELNAGTSLSDLAASFQEAVVDVLVGKTVRAARSVGVPRVFMAGGVAANDRLRTKMQAACDNAGLALYYPPAALCTDNGAMIAATGFFHLKAGQVDDLTLGTFASEPLASTMPGAVPALTLQR